jgi:hypothetical protein
VANICMSTPGYPMSGANGVFTAVVDVAFQRARVATTGVSVLKPIADLPSDLSAKTCELRT